MIDNLLNIPGILALAASWAVVTGGIWKLSERVEKVVTQNARDDVALWLRDADPANFLVGMARAFAAAFDSIFGVRHFSLRCFFRSTIASIISVVILTLIWFALRPNEFSIFFQNEGMYGVFLIFAYGIILNALPDYLSLLESRQVIKWMTGTRSVNATLALLFFDLIATGAIFLIPISTIWFIGSFSSEEIRQFVSSMITLSFGFSIDNPPAGIFFYSTFFTSAWVWLHCLSGLTIKLSKGFGALTASLKYLLDIDNKPFLSIGIVIIIMTTIIYISVSPFVLFSVE